MPSEPIEPAAPAAPAALRWQLTPWSALTREDLYAALQLRALVFVVEQRCPFQDVDGHDAAASHLLGWADDGATKRPVLAAYARLFVPGLVFPEASVGRVVTHPAVRRHGAGRALMREALDRLVDAPGALAPAAPVRIGAQLYLERFYERFGFRRASAVYDEDGIDHVEMVR
jgi:ElaA protein